VPQTTTSRSTSNDVSAPVRAAADRTATPTTAHELIGRMFAYEEALRKCEADRQPGRFAVVTSSEREFLRAEFIADYIRLSIGNLGSTAGYFDAALAAFCDKICDMAVPSVELMGTYLAAVEIVTNTRRLSRIPGFETAVRRTMTEVLRGCVDLLEHRSTAAAPTSQT